MIDLLCIIVRWLAGFTATDVVAWEVCQCSKPSVQAAFGPCRWGHRAVEAPPGIGLTMRLDSMLLVPVRLELAPVRRGSVQRLNKRPPFGGG